jgi:predicted Zn-dependent protease
MIGGVIGVHTGLLLAASNESEVASVLRDMKIAHVTQSHLTRMIAQQKNDSIKTIRRFSFSFISGESKSTSFRLAL